MNGSRGERLTELAVPDDFSMSVMRWSEVGVRESVWDAKTIGGSERLVDLARDCAKILFEFH